jgi:glutathione S-transferase
MVPAWGLATFTPFGLKVIAHLRMGGIPFRLVIEHDPRRGPTGKFPWIVDNGVSIGDSAMIVEHLARTRGHAPDEWLTAERRATAHAVRRMVEDGLCFVLLHTRWVDDTTFRAATDVALQSMPRALRNLARLAIRRRILRDLWGQGILRLAPRDVMALGRTDLDALAALLGDKTFLFGERPCSADASVAAFLAVLLQPPLENELKDHARGLPALSRYTQRMTEEYFLAAT